MFLSFQSQRLHNLFTEVWEGLPAPERVAWEGRTCLATDDPLFLPEAEPHAQGALLSVSVHKAIYILDLNATELHRESDGYIKALMLHLLGTPLNHPKPRTQRRHRRARPRALSR